MRASPARDFALRVLRGIEEHGAYANNLIESASERCGMADADLSLAYLIIYGVLRNRNRLDWVIDQHSRYSVTGLTSWIRNILRMGAYQLLDLPKLHKGIAVDESVKLAHRYGHRGTASLVNAVLRKIASSGHRPIPEMWADAEGHLTIAQSHPKWLVNRWIKRYGAETTLKICSTNNLPAPLTIRLNNLKMTSHIQWKNEFTGAVKSTLIPEGLTIEGPRPIANHRFYAEGKIDIQTLSSMLMGRLLGAGPGDHILDLCSGRGGKSCHLAALMENKGRILCVDRDRRKLVAFKKRAGRLGVNICHILCALSDKEVPFREGAFDRVLVDAPCSALGIIRRHPEIRWLRREEDIHTLAQIQRAILDRAATAVKKGGRVLYCTCSFEPEETDSIMKEFLEGHPGFNVVDLREYLPAVFQEMVGVDGAIRIFPFFKDMDGFFAFCVTK